LIQIKFLGQAGFIFRFDDVIKIGMDLYLSDCVEKIDNFKRLTPKIHTQKDLKDLNFLVASHWHYDHFDVDGLPDLIKEGKNLIAANDCADLMKSINLGQFIAKTKFLKPWDTIQLSNDLTITATPCDHGTLAPLAIGIIYHYKNLVIYYTSDTCLRLDYAKEIQSKFKIDILICPINGAFGNMNEYDAAVLAYFLKPKLVIPCHYWMFAEQGGNPHIFKTFLYKINPTIKVLTMMPGETYEI